MDFTGTIAAVLPLKKGVYISLETGQDITEEANNLMNKKLSIVIKQFREKRSLDANAYLWALLQKMSEPLKTSKDELYIEMLSRYGVFTHIIVKPKIVNRVMEEWRTVRNLGEVTVNGTTGIQLQCYFGSSTYDTKEMSVLIDGVVSECKDLGINTLPEDELRMMKERWGV